jgi:tetratricopeptide (TPR) repeat protein
LPDVPGSGVLALNLRDTQMHSYSVRDVERMLRLSRGTLRGLIEVGFVRPARGPRREYRFSFQDLIVLRAARALIQAKIPRRRIRRSLEELRRRLPAAVPLSGLSISAIGERVVVREGKSRFQVDDGQYLLGLDVSLEDGVLRVVERNELPDEAGARTANDARAPAAGLDAAQMFLQALDLESGDIPAALTAYRQIVELDPAWIAAWINWGRLLHEQGRPAEAEAVYVRACTECGEDARLMFNHGVLLEDMGRPEAALAAYHKAIEDDPGLADCHYNLARLYESLGKPQHAIRHLGEYRRLVSQERP